MSGEYLSTHPRELVQETLDPALVERFLEEHPAFFKHRPELLMSLELPHGGPGAVSLVERQVNLLRERNIDMRHRLATMTRIAEENDSLFATTRQTVLALLDCADARELEATTTDCLRDRFGVEYACQIWFSAAAPWLDHLPEIDSGRENVVAGLLKRGQAFCGVFRAEEMSALFPGCTSEGSAAIAPLIIEDTLVGALAVGSSDVRRYDGDVGTMFLEHLAEVIVRLPFVERQPVS